MKLTFPGRKSNETLAKTTANMAGVRNCLDRLEIVSSRQRNTEPIPTKIITGIINGIKTRLK